MCIVSALAGPSGGSISGKGRAQSSGDARARDELLHLIIGHRQFLGACCLNDLKQQLCCILFRHLKGVAASARVNQRTCNNAVDIRIFNTKTR
jgi:hypothetical protein